MNGGRADEEEGDCTGLLQFNRGGGTPMETDDTIGTSMKCFPKHAVPDTRTLAEGWIRWYTQLTASNSPLTKEKVNDPLECHAGLDGAFLYTGALVVSSLDWPDHPLDVDRLCHVPESVRWIVTPIINAFDYLCGEGEVDRPVNTTEDLLHSGQRWGAIIQKDLKYELFVDGKLWSSKAGPEETLQYSYVTNRLAAVGPPNYDDLPVIIPPHERLLQCNSGIMDPGLPTLAYNTGYFLAIPVKRKSKKHGWPTTFSYHAAIPDFAMDVRYRFVYN